MAQTLWPNGKTNKATVGKIQIPKKITTAKMKLAFLPFSINWGVQNNLKKQVIPKK